MSAQLGVTRSAFRTIRAGRWRRGGCTAVERTRSNGDPRDNGRGCQRQGGRPRRLRSCERAGSRCAVRPAGSRWGSRHQSRAGAPAPSAPRTIFLIDCDDGAETTTVSRSGSTLVTRRMAQVAPARSGSAAECHIQQLVDPRADVHARRTQRRTTFADPRGTPRRRYSVRRNCSLQPRGRDSVGLLAVRVRHRRRSGRDQPPRGHLRRAWSERSPNRRRSSRSTITTTSSRHLASDGGQGRHPRRRGRRSRVDSPFDVTLSQPWNAALTAGASVALVTTTSRSAPEPPPEALRRRVDGDGRHGLEPEHARERQRPRRRPGHVRRRDRPARTAPSTACETGLHVHAGRGLQQDLIRSRTRSATSSRRRAFSACLQRDRRCGRTIDRPPGNDAVSTSEDFHADRRRARRTRERHGSRPLRP